MLSKSVFVFMSTLVAFAYLDPVLKNANNYGPYNLHVDKFTLCKGPKSINATEMTMTVDGQLNVICNYTFFFDCKIDEIKVEVSNMKGDNITNHLYNYKVNDPCKHYSMALLIKQQLNAENCQVKKGKYYNKINLLETMTGFMGNSFFYGKYLFRAFIISKKGNISCFAAKVTFDRK